MSHTIGQIIVVGGLLAFILSQLVLLSAVAIKEEGWHGVRAFLLGSYDTRAKN